MQDPEPNPTSASSGGFRAKCDEWKATAEKSVREEPIKTAGLAFAAGIVLTILPVGRILGGLVRLALALAKPALLILGIAKIADELDRQRKP